MKHNYIILFLLLFIFGQAISFSLVTDHRWEDWYITYRASKNFATGNGFVFNKGERLQTYTSPIGSALPAGIKYVFTKISSRDEATDDWVVWAFRFISAITLTAAVYFLLKGLLFAYRDYVLVAFAAVLTGTSIIIIDNSINGMEAAFMLFFLCLLIYTLIAWPQNRFILLICCYAGIMYSRPDGFIYAGAIILGFVPFHFKLERKQKVGELIKPILPAVAIYLPWLLITYFYYGTFIPHTIVAKSGLRSYHLDIIFSQFIRFNTRFNDTYAHPFMPPYYYFGGWGKYHLILIAKTLGIITSLYWLNIFGNSIGRACSLALYLLHLYLHILSGQGEMPWYLPYLSLLSVLTLFFIFVDLKSLIKNLPYHKILLALPMAAVLLFYLFVYYNGTIELKYQQAIIENGNRKLIGRWLHDNSQPGETVFMEPLGYIGFYSQLKTLDFPGMSSPEVVSARKTLHSDNYADLINYLHPPGLPCGPAVCLLVRWIKTTIW